MVNQDFMVLDTLDKNNNSNNGYDNGNDTGNNNGNVNDSHDNDNG